MALTFVKLGSVSVTTSTQATIEFTSIPQTYTDLYLVLCARGVTNNGSGVQVRLNGATTNFTRRYLETNIISAAGAGPSSDNYYAFQNNASFTASVFSNSSVLIPSYANNIYKSIDGIKLTENNSALCDIGFAAGQWADNSAVTSITLVPEPSVNFAQYSTATLYGIKSS